MKTTVAGSICIWTSSSGTETESNGKPYPRVNSTGFGFFFTTRKNSNRRLVLPEWTRLSHGLFAIRNQCHCPCSVSVLSMLWTVPLISCSLRFRVYKRNTERPTVLPCWFGELIVWFQVQPSSLLTSCLLPVMTDSKRLPFTDIVPVWCKSICSLPLLGKKQCAIPTIPTMHSAQLMRVTYEITQRYRETKKLLTAGWDNNGEERDRQAETETKS